MIGQRLAQYVIVARIGAGGMGEVYRARDERLERDVAIKVLPAGLLTDEAARKRFRKEALALAKLNHPNIATIHDFNSQDGVDFLVMEYVPGSSLAEKLAAGPLSEKETLRLGAQVAAALEEAHEHGIIHRDLKPGNILLTSRGTVKVLDFGLAKLLQPTQGEAVTAESLTETHAGAGTLPYMAPEQLRGEPVDTRTDIHGLGAVLYEMCTGQRPFPETQGPRLIDAILHQAPVPPSRLNPRLAAQLETVILKALEKDPERRYQSARELRVDLERLATPASTPAPVTRTGGLRRRVIPMAAAIVLLLSALVAFNLGGLRHRLLGRDTPQIQSLAVLPLENLSGDPEQEYFADGMTEALITELAQLSGLKKVTSRTSVMRFKKKDKSIPEIAGILKVDAIIEGSVTRYGDQVRVTVQLIHGETDRHLWAKSFDRELRNVLALHSEIAQAIASEVRVALTPRERALAARARSVNPQAYEAYLRGRFAFQAHEREAEKNRISIEWFERAVQIDSDFALAHAALARAYIARFFSYDPRPEWEEKASIEIEKALALDPNLAEAYVARGDLTWTLSNQFPHERALQEYKRALALNPNLPDAHFGLGSVYQHIGLFEKSLEHLRAAVALDPLRPEARYRIPRVYLYQQDYLTALAEFERNPDFPLLWQWQKALALFYLRRNQEALSLIERIKQEHPRQEDVAATYAILLAAMGEQQKAEEQIRIAIEDGQGKSHFHHAAYNIACAYALMGKKRLALEWLERAAKEGLPCYPLFDKDPNLNSLRGDPDFAAFLARVRSHWERLQASL